MPGPWSRTRSSPPLSVTSTLDPGTLHLPAFSSRFQAARSSRSLEPVSVVGSRVASNARSGKRLRARTLGNALARIARLGDAFRGAGQATHRRERRPGDERARECGEEDATNRHEDEDQAKPVEVVVEVVDVSTDYDCAEPRHRHHDLAVCISLDGGVAIEAVRRSGCDLADAGVDR